MTTVREQGQEAWEALCNPSGGCKTACCTYEGSPCEHLETTNTRTLAGRCRIYETRFGTHRNLEGQAFQCVPYAEYLKHRPAHAKCGYAAVASIEGVPVIRGQG